MQQGQGGTYLVCEAAHVLPRQWSELPEVAPIEQFHGVVRLVVLAAEIIHAHDARVGELR